MLIVSTNTLQVILSMNIEPLFSLIANAKLARRYTCWLTLYLLLLWYLTSPAVSASVLKCTDIIYPTLSDINLSVNCSTLMRYYIKSVCYSGNLYQFGLDVISGSLSPEQQSRFSQFSTNQQRLIHNNLILELGQRLDFDILKESCPSFACYLQWVIHQKLQDETADVSGIEARTPHSRGRNSANKL